MLGVELHLKAGRTPFDVKFVPADTTCVGQL